MLQRQGGLVLAVICCRMLTAGMAAAEDAAAGTTARIAGTVRRADGRELVRPKVTLHQWDSTGHRWKPADKTVDVNGEGEFAFEALPADQYWCVAVETPEAGRAFRAMATEAGQTARAVVTVRPAVTGFISVKDEQGRPLAGAKFRSWEIVDGTEGAMTVKRGSEAGLGLPESVSDAEGRLFLPGLPEGAVLKSVWIDHPEFAAVSFAPDAVLRAGEVAACELKPGFPVRLQFLAEKTPAPPALPEVVLMLYHEDLRHADSILRIPWAVRDGGLEFRLHGGRYQILRAEAERYCLTPQMSTNNPDRLRIAEGEHDRWTFRALPKVLVRGRVVNGEGKPLAKTMLLGEIENLLADGSPAPKEWSEWSFTEWGETDAEGEYRIPLAPGRGRISYEGGGLPSAHRLEVTIDGTAEQRVPDIVVRDLPTIRGVVLGVDGAPAAGAIVRPHSDSTIRYGVKPVLTDEQGRFEFTLPHLPVNLKTEARMYEHTVFASLPHESVGGVTTFDLHDAEAAGKLTIRMESRPADWPLAAMRDAFSEWERGSAESRPDRKLTAENSAGAAVPELDGSLWLNTEKRSLADFRGQYVLLDFYTTWCGPCNGDFPTVKAVHDLFRERGAAVICVHDNSSPHEEIRAHAAKHGMEMPIVVDHADGRILKAWEAAGLVYGYPSYLLLDPEGRLAASDRTIPGPLLRVYKIELARQWLLQRDEAGRGF